MSPFPSPLLAPPTLALYQGWFRGFTFGGIVLNPGTVTSQIVSVDGLDGIPISGGDSQRALDTGMFAGIDVGGERDITFTMVVGAQIPPGGATALAAARSALAAYRQEMGAAFGVPGYVSESPLYIQMENGLFCCMARPEKYNFTLDLNMVQAIGGTATCLLRATDPRLYAAPTESLTVGLPAPAGGVKFNLTFNVLFGGGGTGGLLSVDNSGTIEMRPVIIFTGPCTNPVLTNLSINGAPSIGFTIVLNAGDTLTVDTDFQTAVYIPSGSTQGQSVRNLGMSTNVWWNLGVGTSTLEFLTSDGLQVAGTCTVWSADAWAGV